MCAVCFTSAQVVPVAIVVGRAALVSHRRREAQSPMVRHAAAARALVAQREALGALQGRPAVLADRV